MYIPIELNSPILVGAVVAYLVRKSGGSDAVGQQRHERGTLISSGLIAGGALAGVAGALIQWIGSVRGKALLPEPRQHRRAGELDRARRLLPAVRLDLLGRVARGAGRPGRRTQMSGDGASGPGATPKRRGLAAWVVRHAAALRLFFLAFLTLYLELALIRFTSAEVLHLGYFSNLVLVAVFLGIGVGFLLAPRKLRLAPALPVALLFLVAFVLVAKIDVTVLRERAAGDVFFGFGSAGSKLSPWAALPLLFATTVLVFAAIAQETGRAFGHFAPLRAYSLDIAGSLAGIALFSLHAWLEGTPLLWFIVAFVLVLGLAARGERLPAVLAGVGVVLLLVAAAPAHYVAWSPYQRIDVFPVGRGADGAPVGYSLTANGIGHQTMAPLDAKEPIPTSRTSSGTGCTAGAPTGRCS